MVAIVYVNESVLVDDLLWPMECDTEKLLLSDVNVDGTLALFTMAGKSFFIAIVYAGRLAHLVANSFENAVSAHR